MQTNKFSDQLPLHNYEPVSEEDYADLKFDTEETRPFSYDLDQRDKGVNKFDIVMDNLVSGVNAFVQLSDFAASPISKFDTPELNWTPEYNSAMEEIVETARKNPVKFTQAVAQGALESVYDLATDYTVIPEYIKNISSAAKDHFTKSIDEYLIEMYGPEVTVFTASEKQLTEARSAMLFRTLEASELLGIGAVAPKVTKAIAKSGINTYNKGVDYLSYSAPEVKQNLLDVADGLASKIETEIGLVPVRIDGGRRNNTASSLLDKVSAMLLPETPEDRRTNTGSMYKSSGWGSRQTYGRAKQKIENYFFDLEDRFDYHFEENFTEDFKKLSVFHQEEALDLLRTVWEDDGWSVGPNNRLFTEMPDNLATFDANKFIKSSFSDIKNPSLWETIMSTSERPFKQPIPIPGQMGGQDLGTNEYSFNNLDADGDIKSLGTSVDPPEFKLGDLLNHKQLFKAYPELQNFKIRFFSNYEMKSQNSRNNLGTFNYKNPVDDYIAINYKYFKGKSPKEYMPVLLHEIQHAIEQRSGVDVAGKIITKNHLNKKLEMVDQTLKDIKPYTSGTLKAEGFQSRAFLQGSKQGGYNVIFLPPNDIAFPNGTSKENLQAYLKNEHKITLPETEFGEWTEIDINEAENLLKIKYYETKSKLGGEDIINFSPFGKDEVSLFSRFTEKTPKEIATGSRHRVSPGLVFDQINKLVFDQGTPGITPIDDMGNIFAPKNMTDGSPTPKLSLNLEPDFFTTYLAKANEAFSSITEYSFKMSAAERRKRLPYERIGLDPTDIVKKKGTFYGYKPGEVNNNRKVSLSELVYYLADKQSATKTIEELHANIVDSIKKSKVMRENFIPQFDKAARDANLNSFQADKYYENWVSGFADSLLFSRFDPHVIIGSNIRYAELKELGVDSNELKHFTQGLSDFGMPETADIIYSVQNTFLKKYVKDSQMNPEAVNEFELLEKIDNIWRDTQIKLEEIENVTPLFNDVNQVSGLSAGQNYIDPVGLKIDKEKYFGGGY